MRVALTKSQDFLGYRFPRQFPWFSPRLLGPGLILLAPRVAWARRAARSAVEASAEPVDVANEAHALAFMAGQRVRDWSVFGHMHSVCPRAMIPPCAFVLHWMHELSHK